jgi:hypothetical protein
MAIYLGSLELATGGGATGTGLPVNTYESFNVSTTGNPTGYDATTGLYTHPNGDYWLKTGKILSGTNASTYPDATLGGATPVATTRVVPLAYDTSGQACYIDGSNGVYAVQHYGPTSTRIAEYSFATGGATGKVIDTNTQFPNGAGTTGGISYDSSANVVWSFYRYNVVSSATELKLASYNYTTGANLTNQTIYRAPSVSTANNIPFGISKINNTPEYVIYSKQNGTEMMQVWNMSTGSAVLVSTVNTSLYASTYYYLTESANANKIMLWKYDAGKFVEFETTNFTATGVETSPVSSFINSYGSYAFYNNLNAVTNNAVPWPSSYQAEWILGSYIGDQTVRTDTDTTKPLFVKLK